MISPLVISIVDVSDANAYFWPHLSNRRSDDKCIGIKKEGKLISDMHWKIIILKNQK